MAKKKSAYLGLPYIISVILAIIPVTAWIFGILQCISEGRILPAIFRVIFGFWIVWVLDLIFMILKKQLCHFLFLW
jgi:hypothetical protein